MISSVFSTSSTLLLSLALSPVVLAQSTITVPAALPTNEPSYVENAEFRSAVLNSTNFFRKQHDAEPLKWNDSLAETAKDWSDDCEFEHSGGPTGENLAQGYVNVSAAVDAWGNERDEYDFDDQGFDKKTGHFTQMVWKSTTTIGCGRKFCDNDFTAWYLVCEYYPQGNVGNEFEENVAKQNSEDGENDTAEEDTGDDNGTVDSDSSDDDDCPQGADCSSGPITRPNLALLVAMLAIMAA